MRYRARIRAKLITAPLAGDERKGIKKVRERIL